MMIPLYLTQFLTILDDQRLVLKLTGWRIDTRTRTHPGFNPWPHVGYPYPRYALNGLGEVHTLHDMRFRAGLVQGVHVESL
jgi:hypothetical protein